MYIQRQSQLRGVMAVGGWVGVASDRKPGE